jgi:3-hydroxyisobutyrate dehydrogenase-like beta-hydroxyacid dehydrogenase
MTETTPARVAFLGLGVMGFPMAGYLAKAGHDVVVYNRTAAKAEAWATKFGGRAAATPDEAAAGRDAVFMCVGNDDDVRSVGGRALAALPEGAILADHTTASATVAREMAAVAASQGKAFLDAPITGGQAGAENGTLSIMVGGEEAAFERARPLMACYARSVVRMGGPGAGQLTKMCNQITIAGLIQSLAEALSFAQAAGLDPERVVEVISKGAAQSWQMDNRARTMLEGRFDFGFAVDWMRKDMGICLDEARRNGARLPVAALVDQFYAEIQRQDGGRLDTSSLMLLVRNAAKAD